MNSRRNWMRRRRVIMDRKWNWGEWGGNHSLWMKSLQCLPSHHREIIIILAELNGNRIMLREWRHCKLNYWLRETKWMSTKDKRPSEISEGIRERASIELQNHRIGGKSAEAYGWREGLVSTGGYSREYIQLNITGKSPRQKWVRLTKLSRINWLKWRRRMEVWSWNQESGKRLFVIHCHCRVLLRKCDCYCRDNESALKEDVKRLETELDDANTTINEEKSERIKRWIVNTGYRLFFSRPSYHQPELRDSVWNEDTIIRISNSSE